MTLLVHFQPFKGMTVCEGGPPINESMHIVVCVCICTHTHK